MNGLKFLVMTHLVEPLQDSGYRRLGASIEYFKKVRAEKRAEVYSLVGRKGFAIIIDVKSHDELIDVLHRSPTVQDEDYRVFPLGSVEGETATASGIVWEHLVNK